MHTTSIKTSSKKIGLALVLAPSALLFLLAGVASAQAVKAKPDNLAKIETHYMDTRLALNAEQRHQVQKVNLHYAKKLEPVMKDSSDTPARAKKIAALEKERDGKLKGVLTADQFSRYMEVKSDMGDYVREQLREEEGKAH